MGQDTSRAGNYNGRMNKTLRLILAGVLALLLALFAGWLWGRSGRSELEAALAADRLRVELVEARALVLEARVEIYGANFGNASQRIESAKPHLRAARDLFNELRQNEPAGSLSTALDQLDEAQRLANTFDQTANARAADALRSIDAALASARGSRMAGP
jgi:hypothetical protein